MSLTTRPDRIILIGGAAVYLAALLVLVCTEHTGLRYSSDTAATRPLVGLWLPGLVGVGLALLVPPKRAVPQPLSGLEPRRAARQGWYLAGLAVAFAVAINLVHGANDWFIGLKLVLLLGPLVLRWATVREWAGLGLRGRWLRPLPGAIGFLAVTNLLWPWHGGAANVTVLLVGFVMNAVIEEIFYRFWLQTRLEIRYGRWPAIVVSALLWSVWHAAIQGGDGLGIDLAAAIAGKGGTGLFLGYLWSRYRNPWILLAVHGFVNAPIGMLLGSR
ncbi:CPBP family intramembrane glutamic endopeptidase [Nocardia terpenica]|uniref:CAAX prenyl protease 2/Lysostaphin resistance protein A-like domain-containing protein n=1 Tax=Nocardia terpenica TaxID=455432 RepID=A0A164NCD8_9NOCA|nr:CPBP family intramembrane glutamic endopeptidase [Nocardia terpenica]KZM74212.1 hypothetical protein AWN90_26280 [Nocardia terpenica]NQE92809.1 CPBP family intramembrane metalloprotease [Nocardia terpenica]